MIIYFEGADASGKSTLIKAIADRLKELQRVNKLDVHINAENIVPTRPGRPDRISPTELIKRWVAMATDINTVYLMDRGPISDVIYRTFDQYHPVVNLMQFYAIYIAYYRLITVIHCDSSGSEEALKARGDDNPIALKHHQQIRYLFKQIMPMFGALTYDFEEAISPKKMRDKVNVLLAYMFNSLKDFRERMKQDVKTTNA